MTDKGNAPGPEKTHGNAKYSRWITEDGLILLQGWARGGLTEEQIAKKCSVSPSTLSEWKNKFPEIAEALKEGKEVIDTLVENALLKRALGYTYEEKTYERKQVTEEGDMGMVLTKTVTKEVIPDTTAQIFWLKNRKKADWRDNAERLEMEREKLELDKRLTDAQIRKIEKETDDDKAVSVKIEFDAVTEEGGWAK